jgi:hypothetical protein
LSPADVWLLNHLKEQALEQGKQSSVPSSVSVSAAHPATTTLLPSSSIETRTQTQTQDPGKSQRVDMINAVSPPPKDTNDAQSREIEEPLSYPKWILNSPASFRYTSANAIVDVRNDKSKMDAAESFSAELLKSGFPSSDGESVDSLEHFFWGMEGGVAIELGALDGTKSRNSVTYGYEEMFGWRRILIEGNPENYVALQRNSPKAFSVGAAICNGAEGSVVDFVKGGYAGGVANTLYGRDPSTDTRKVVKVPCVAMREILRLARVKHVNLMVLDVEVRFPVMQE